MVFCGVSSFFLLSPIACLCSPLVGLIPWANVGIGFLFRFVNMWMVNVPYKWRMLINTAFLLIGTVGIAFSVYVNFAFALVMIVLVGIASSFGESILLTYQRNFPPEVVGGWSSGTGLAGVGGALLYILFSAVLNFTNQETFLCLIPTVIMYMMAYGLMLELPDSQISSIATAPSDPSLATNVKDNVTVQKRSGKSSSEDDLANNTPLTTPLINASQDAANESFLADVTETSLQRYWRCTKLVAWPAFNLMAVYFFEYVASVGAADKAQMPGSTHSLDWFVRNSFVLLAFAYQFGVFISRSSLKVIQIRRVWILTVIQAGNFVLWILQAYYKFMPIGAQLPMMMFVGLLGGASYVNIFYLLLNDEKYPKADKELLVNMAAVCINLGIVLSSVFTILMDATFLSTK